MTLSLTKWILPTFAAGMFGFAVQHTIRESKPVPEPAPPSIPARAPFDNVVAASGIVEARTENMAIGSALSGIVQEVYVSQNSVGTRVKAGTRLFRVDDRHLRAQLVAHQAKLQSARAQLLKLAAMPRVEEVPPVEAKVRSLGSELAMLEDQVKRESVLRTRLANTEENLIQRRLARDAGQHKLDQAKAELSLIKAGAWSPDLEIARAAVLEVEAVVAQDEVEIDRAIVRTPVDGDLLKVDVRPGEAVTATSTKALVLLGDLQQVHVRAEVDEEDIHRFRTHTQAKASLRGDSKNDFRLTFVRIEPYVIPKKTLTGDNNERVDTRVLQVIYSLDKAGHEVHVGQQMDVFIEAGDQVLNKGSAAE
jgi:multidrug resistance efflux pump